MHHFQVVISHLIPKDQASTFLVPDTDFPSDWALRLFQACQSEAASSSTDFFTSFLAAPPPLLWAETWCLWEAARFCVTSRLRTPFGSPTHLFETIERAVVSVAKLAKGAGPDPHQGVVLRRATNLLSMVDFLEKQVYNAYEGSHLLASCSPQAVGFFRGNRKVCEDWFARVRQPLLLASLACNMGPLSIFHGTQKLKEIATLVQKNLELGKVLKELERCLPCIIHILARYGTSDTIAGIHIWLKSLLVELQQKHFLFPWLEAALLCSRGNFERGADHFLKLVTQMLGSKSVRMEHDIFQLASTLITTSYVELHDWAGLSSWPSVLEEARTIYPSVENGCDPNFLRALMTFETQGSQAAQELLRSSQVLEVGSNVGYHMTWLSCEQQHLSSLVRLSSLQGTSVIQSDLHRTSSVLISILQDSHHLLPAQIQETLLLLSATDLLEELAGKGGARIQARQPQITSDTFSSLSQPTAYLISKFDEIGGLFRGASQSPSVSRYLGLIVARTQGNLRFAEHLVSKTELAHLPLEFLLEQAQIKLFRGEHTEVLRIIAEILRPADHLHRAHFLPVNEVKSIALLTASWLVSGEKLADAVVLGELSPLLSGLREDSSLDPRASHATLVESLLVFSAHEAPGFGRAWFKLASWVYRQGWELLDRLRLGKAADILTSSENARLLELVGPTSTSRTPESVVDDLYSAFRGVLVDDTKEETLPTLRSQILRLAPQTQVIIEDILEVLEKVRDRLLSYYSRAIEGYFRFLAIGSSTASAFSDLLAESYDQDSEECTLVTASLRILRLLVKYGVHLQKPLSNGIEKSSALCWQDIAPQLFARLGHPEEFVRKKLTEIICKISAVAPESVAYPTLVATFGLLLLPSSSVCLPA